MRGIQSVPVGFEDEGITWTKPENVFKLRGHLANNEITAGWSIYFSLPGHPRVRKIDLKSGEKEMDGCASSLSVTA